MTEKYTGILIRQFGGDEHTQALLKRLNNYGFGRFSLLTQAGVVYDAGIVGPVRPTRYTVAIDEIKIEEDSGKLALGTTQDVLHLILNGEFDNSDWAQQYGHQSDEAAN